MQEKRETAWLPLVPRNRSWKILSHKIVKELVLHEIIGFNRMVDFYDPVAGEKSVKPSSAQTAHNFYDMIHLTPLNFLLQYLAPREAVFNLLVWGS